MVIHGQKSASSNPAVLFEVKRPRDKGQTANEMMRPDKANVKALHELILYFLRERIEHQNTDLKYLVVTDIHQWFVFDAADFERLFYKNRQLVKDYKDWCAGRKTSSTTDFFYQQIAQPLVARITEEVPCTQFELRDYAKYAHNDDPTDDHKLIPLYKILSPAHLLRLPFANDSNSLNKDFYYELLHLIGLEETKVKNKKVIQRKPVGQRDNGSLLENAIRTLETEDRLRRVPKLSSYGSSRDEQLFGVALELCITWVNRVLFLKLLEAQLLKYHQGDPAYRFLNQQAIKDYDELNELFFEALAKRKADRLADIADKFARVPYLNSSLFEISDLEDATIRINSMKDRFALPLYSHTVLKDEKGKRLTGERRVLDYLFAFLDAYDFSSEGSESIQEENKNLINASVLGLIFEKINGYQDGAFFTPGFITMYMCRETLRRATVQKFQESTAFADFDSEDFADLQNYLARKYAAADLQAANACINRLKICDPAVGSGHFLVSALNELLTLKSELGILCDRQGKPLPVRLEVANDELSIQWRHNDDFYAYQPGVHDNHLVQEALFYEKQTLIENCLFGVDLNPNSVKICRLRLWIELLKNAYYRKDAELETLPNIDINIKQGNSLVSRFALDADLKPVLAKSKWTITDYRLAVSSYQHATDKSDKQELLAQINRIKSDFQTHISNNDPLFKKLSKFRGQKLLLENKAEIGNLFEKLSDKDITADLKKLNTSIENTEAEIENIRDAKIYENAFEWRFEFPEVLDGEGNFVGFDAILGNPPYIRIQDLRSGQSEIVEYFNNSYETAAKGNYDIYVLFTEMGLKLLQPLGELSYIMPNKFTNSAYGAKIRTLISRDNLLRKMVNFNSDQVFDDATTYTGLFFFDYKDKLGILYSDAKPNDLLQKTQFNLVPQRLLGADNWNFIFNDEADLFLKIKSEADNILSDVTERIFQGLKTSADNIYILELRDSDDDYFHSFSRETGKLYELEKGVTNYLIKGGDSKRYCQAKPSLVIIFPYQNSKLISPDEFQEYAPNVWNYLKENEKYLRQREGGRMDKEGWYGYIYPKALDVIMKPKLFTPDIAPDSRVSFDITGEIFFTGGTAGGYGITPKKEISPYYLLGLLNSKIFMWYIENTSTQMKGGWYSFESRFIRDFPVKLPVNNQIEHFSNEVYFTKSKNDNTDTTALEAEIDLLVYHLYELTYDEVLLVDPEFALTEEAYNNHKAQMKND